MSEAQWPVWVWLPNETRPIQAGSFASTDEAGRFSYCQDYIANPLAVALDPVRMPLGHRHHVEKKNGGIFGILRDAGPDSWGIEQLEKKHGRTLLLIEALTLAPGDGVGMIALGHVDQSGWMPWRISDLCAALDAPETPVMVTALGGAKPKTTIDYEGRLYLAKLPERGDSPWLPHLEHAGLRLASDCKIESCNSLVYDLPNGQSVLLVERFDRFKSADGWPRKGYASAATVLRLGQRGLAESNRSYLALAHEMRRWCGRAGADPADQIRELWRRIVFNGLIGNRDDHTRNHGFLQEGQHWRLSPAFDLVPGPAPAGQPFGLSLPFFEGPEGLVSVVTYDHLIAAAMAFGYTRHDAVHTLADMAATVRDGWRKYLGHLPKEACDRAAICFTFATTLGHAAEAEIASGILPEPRRSRGLTH